MPYEIKGFKLNGLHEKVGIDINLDRTLNNLDRNPRRILWQHPNIKMLGLDPQPFILGLDNDHGGVLKHFSLNTPTSHRTLCFDLQDRFGNARYVVKGVELTPNKFDGVDVTENTDFIQKKRFGSIVSSGEAGKESVSAACADIGGFVELSKLNPQILLDFNGPIWQPLTVLNTGRKMIEGDIVWMNGEWTHWPFAQYGAIDIRRFPYTHWRIEDVSFDSTKQRGIEEITRLAKTWNLPDRQQVYLRSIKRWSQASSIFINSKVRHSQVFGLFKHKETGLNYAWINSNNIALDGSTGDLDCTRKYIDKWDDKNKGRLEAVAGFLIYLYGINKLDTQLLKNGEFLSSAINTFFKHLDRSTSQTIKLEKDFVRVSELCRNSVMLYNLNTPDGEFMPGRSSFQKEKNRTEILPFMQIVGLKINALIH